ncbi:MAG: PhzF family phenazine biosynthesis protein [Thermoproteales archaeon]|nr:PhzF family phenazine biosynthesis protein [Thermoproteales archaeon]
MEQSHRNARTIYQITSEQGYAIKRSGKIYVKIIVKNGKPAQVKVGGKAATTLKGRLRIR